MTNVKQTLPAGETLSWIKSAPAEMPRCFEISINQKLNSIQFPCQMDYIVAHRQTQLNFSLSKHTQMVIAQHSKDMEGFTARNTIVHVFKSQGWYAYLVVSPSTDPFSYIFTIDASVGHIYCSKTPQIDMFPSHRQAVNYV
jgi:hypothetical protein